MNASAIEIVGTTGGMVISLSLIPQVYKTYQTKDASNISFIYQIIYIIGCTMINIYAIYTKLWIIYIPCIVEQTLIVTLTIMKLYYDGVQQQRLPNPNPSSGAVN